MSYYRYVNTKMGSFNHERYSNGNCYPACAVPHGMNFFSIQTSGANNWFYSPMDKSFEGIRLTHLPSPWLPDYNKLLIWGARGESDNDTHQYWSSFDNRKNIIEPAYILIEPHRDNYKIELTPTNSCAILRFTFEPENTANRIVFKSARFMYEFDESEGTLYMINSDSQEIYKGFASKERKSIAQFLVIKTDVSCKIIEKDGRLSLVTTSDNVEVRIATSYVSFDQAKLNLEREIGTKSFDDVKAETEALWESYLSKIEIEDGDEEKKATFYSCLYRFNLWPRRFYELDADGKAIHVNTANGEITNGVLYTDNGFWDTYRTCYPLLSLLDTDAYREMAEGFYNYYVDTGWLPKWVCPHNVNCMPGMLVEATMGDAIVKNIVEGELAENIFQAMLKDGEYESEIRGEGRVMLGVYRKYGYYPYTMVKESVNETLDNAYGDYAIAKAAEKLGYEDIAKKYFAYSKNYQNLFDANTGFIRGKDENGDFRDEVFNPYSWGRDYTEGSAWQNAFGVYHDIEGLDKLYCGRLQEKIDDLMIAPPKYYIGSYGRVIHEMAEVSVADYGQCAISNQPSFHIPYIYSELGNPIKTSMHVEKLLKLFNSGIEGYPGDEDNGSTSAWYILSSLGLYQVAPSRPDFATAVPSFEKATVKLANGNILEIVKSEYEPEKMNGRVSYFEVMRGGRLSKKVSKG